MKKQFPSLLQKYETMLSLFQERVLRQPDQVLYTFLSDGETEDGSLTYRELDQQARTIAALLQNNLSQPGERVLLLYPPGLEYISAFWGCLYAGMVAVPSYPPRLNRPDPRLQTIAQDAQARVALTTPEIVASIQQRLANTPDLASITWLTTQGLDRCIADQWQEPDVTGSTLAFLQYTSGSTAQPKGVMVSHSNLVHNLEQIHQFFGVTSHSRGVFWLPPYHDMGLIGGILEPLYGGASTLLMPPTAFLQKPVRWLQAISRSRATMSGAPNFAYDFCAQKITEEQKQGLDLSSWELAFCGAEPVRRETLERFVAAFAPYGFRREAFYPCYGLAEATLIASGSTKGKWPAVHTFSGDALAQNRVALAAADEQNPRELISCGVAAPNQQLLIVDPQTLEPCSADRVGEIWLSGPSIAQGYWNRPEATSETFWVQPASGAEAAFMRTGDLGFLYEGEVYIAGRAKDLIIIRGRNHYPQDIELTVEKSHPALPSASCAAFSVEVAGEERLVIVQELDRHTKQDEAPGMIDAIRQAVVEQHELQAYAVVLIRVGSIPRTSSFKIQRRACRTQMIDKTLAVIAASVLETETSIKEKTPAVLVRETLLALEPEARKTPLEAYLLSRVAQALHLPASRLDAQQPISSLGIDSLAAVELQHVLESDLGVSVPMVSFLEGLSIRGLAASILPMLDASDSTIDLAAADNADVYPLSPGQRALWFLHQLAPESSAYHIVNAVRLRMDLDVPALRQAFETIVLRHPALRTTFMTAQGEIRQRVHTQAVFDFFFEDIVTSGLETRLAELARQPFDLANGPLLRVHLFKLGEREYMLLITLHHIVADLWSMAVLLRELGTLYQGESLPALPLQYADYVRWQANVLAGEQGGRLWDYWREQLGGDAPALDLPTDRPRPPVQTYHGASHTFTLDENLGRRLKALAQAEGVTLYTLLLAAFQVWLHRLTGQDDIRVGSPTTGRSHAGLAGLVGYFVNPIVLRANLSENPAFSAFLRQARETTLAALAHQDYPFVTLVERLQPQRDLSRSPLFQVVFAMQKAHLGHGQSLTDFALSKDGAQVTVGGLTLEAMALQQQIAQFDLTLMMGEQDETLAAALQYNTDLFDASTIARLADGFQTLLAGIAADPAQCLSDLPLVTETERELLLETWNDTHRDYPADASLQRLFETQAGRAPEAVAVTFPTPAGEQHLSYGELNRRANQLAHSLRKLGVGPNVLVGICMERSLDLVVALLGIIKAGGAYVPLDSSYPPERLAYMLETTGSQMSVLLTTTMLAAQLPAQHPVTTLCLDTDWPQIAIEDDSNPITDFDPERLAYVIFTSGSTGKPKGTLVTAKGLLNLCLWYQSHCPITEASRVLLVLSFSFDACYKNIFTPLISGGRLVLAPIGYYDPLKLVDVIESQKVTVINATPSMIQPVVDLARQSDYRSLSSLAYLGLGGEALQLTPLRAWLNSPHCRCALHNIYGPTECADISTSYHVSPAQINTLDTVPIGMPIDNMRAYVLDPHGNLQPIGAAGELCLAGDGLAHGYLDHPDLTAEKFVPIAAEAATKDGGPLTVDGHRPPSTVLRLYRTGDRARRLPDGNIEYLGRIDQQVKVRGFRIELGEIEAALQQHPAIGEALVVAHETKPGDGHKHLVAYLTTTLQPAPSISDLRNFLKATLPEYMLPAAFVFLERFPLTPNGKVDRRVLPVPQDFRPMLETVYIAPQGELEQQIAAIWQESLKVERVGVNDNFFDLGGHSLSMTQVHIKLRETLSREIDLVDLFKYPTVGALAQYLSRGDGAPAQGTPEAPLLEGRQRLRQQLERRQRGGLS